MKSRNNTDDSEHEACWNKWHRKVPGTNTFIHWHQVKSKVFGYITIAHTKKGICAITNANEPDDALEEMFPEADFHYVYSHQYAQQIVKQLETNIDLDKIPIHILNGTPFQKLVWEELRKIPSGVTITYQQLAERIGRPKAVRAVGTACKNNPIPIIIGCHRVVHKIGGIGNYAWGTNLKQRLLEWEKNKWTYSAL